MARQSGEVRRQQIAEAVLEIIAERGLHGLTAREIGRRLGISDAAVFRHLPNKQAVMRAAIDRVEQLLFDGFPPAGPDPISRLGEFFRQRAAVIVGRPGFARVMFSGELADNAALEDRERVREFKRRSAGFVRGCLEEARIRGLLRSGIETREASLLIMGALMALLFSKQAPAPAGHLRREAEILWNTLAHVLCGKNGAATRRRGTHRKKGK